MAVPFNGVFLSRMTSALIPITSSFNTLELQNLTINHILMDKKTIHDDTNTEITAAAANLADDITVEWHPDTEVNGKFNGSLEIGPLSNSGNTIEKVAIKRTSNRSNFTSWEDLAVFAIDADNTTLDKTYDDTLVESGVIYRYAIQPINSNIRGPLSTAKEAIVNYEYSWLIGEEEQQLMVGYDSSISDYRIVIKESSIETLGSQYPYVSRNGKVGYKQFQYSSTITKFMDFDNSFMDNTNMFLDSDIENDGLDKNVEEYNTFFKENGMDTENNYIIEREFRNKIMEFLYNGKPKLFKSDTEGLMLVKLTNISLSPKETLGRTIYSFSCTVTEIAPVNFDSLVANKIKKELS